ncbi:SRPBCC family protein [Mycobacteroides sp. LB1]|uniref:SRPBCC family protein n=1 Tax=Mycobacteroides sp. LB1 TaxID=2750814 RepID=UPI00210410E6
MPVVSQTVEVVAPPQVIVSIVTNYEAYPEWNKEITSVDILERLPDGRPRIVRLKVETSGMSSTNVAEIAYLNAAQVATRLLESDIFEKQEQTFSIVPMGPTCLLTVDMDVETKLPIPKPMVKKLANQVLEHLAEGLKTRAEQIASGAIAPPVPAPAAPVSPGYAPPPLPPGTV